MQIEITANTIYIAGIILPVIFLLSLAPASKNILYRPFYNLMIGLKYLVFMIITACKTIAVIITSRVFTIMVAVEIALASAFSLYDPDIVKSVWFGSSLKLTGSESAYFALSAVFFFAPLFYVLFDHDWGE